MKMRERLITDLEEELLFLLSVQEGALSGFVLSERVGKSMNKFISLAHVHKTLISLEQEGLICAATSNAKRNYTITPAGIATLQTDWSHYSKNVYRS